MMPTGDATVLKLNVAFSPENIAATAGAHKNTFAPGKGLQLGWVFDNDPDNKALLEGYIETMPAGIQEAFRATVLQALTGTPRTPVVFTYEPAYDFEVRITQTPNTKLTPGIITIALRGRYISDEHPLANAMRKARQARPIGERRSSRSPAKGARRPAKRRAPRKSS
ncbi:MAG: hypothetical protein ACT4OF_04235 [Caulobacteraceae bacterium]